MMHMGQPAHIALRHGVCMTLTIQADISPQETGVTLSKDIQQPVVRPDFFRDPAWDMLNPHGIASSAQEPALHGPAGEFHDSGGLCQHTSRHTLLFLGLQHQKLTLTFTDNPLLLLRTSREILRAERLHCPDELVLITDLCHLIQSRGRVNLHRLATELSDKLQGCPVAL